MRFVIMMFLMVFAVPALAQQEPECRGKKGFRLADGSYGCLLKTVESGVGSSKGQRFGAFTHSSNQAAAGLVVAIFGNFSKSQRVSNSRFRGVCNAFKGEAQAVMKGKRYGKVVVYMYWPRIAVPNSDEPLRQDAYMSNKCTSVGHFGERPA